MFFRCLILFLTAYLLVFPSCTWRGSGDMVKRQKQLADSLDFRVILDSADSICKAEKLDSGLPLFLGAKSYRKGHQFLKDRKTEEAAPLLSVAIDCFRKIDFKVGLGYAYLVSAYNYQQMHMSDSALYNFERAKQQLTAANDTMGMIVIYNNLGIYLYELGAFELSFENYKVARKLVKPESLLWLTVEYNVANYLVELVDTAAVLEAKEIYLNLLQHDELLDSLFYSNIYNSLAGADVKLERGEQAQAYVEKSMTYQPNATFDYMHVQYLNLAHSFLIQQKKQEYDSVMSMVGGRYDEMELNGKLHYSVLRMMNRLYPDISCLEDYVNVSKEVFERGFANKLSLVQQEVEVHDQKKVIDTLAQTNKTQKDRLHANAMATAIIAVMVVLLVAFVIMMFSTVKKVRKSRQLLNEEKQKTERINADLAEALEVKNKLMAIVAHDIRGPVGGLKQLIDVHSHMPYITREELDGLFNTLNQASTSVYYLLDNLLLWANNQNGHIRFSPHLQNVIPVVESAVEDVQGWAMMKNIKISFRNIQKIEAKVDENMLKTVIRNLVSNAIKFSEKDSVVSLDVETRNGEVLFSVNDKGKGMTQQQVAALFGTEANKHAFSAEKRHGFGLLVCRDFVSRHSGKLWAESAVGKGTSVRFSIPR